jgi:chromosome segregation ATPase
MNSPNILDLISEIELKSKSIYGYFDIPIYKQKPVDCLKTLHLLKENLEELTKNINSINSLSLLNYSSEIDSEKIKFFINDFLTIINKVKKQIFLEENTKQVDNDLLNIKAEITRPEIYFDIEKNLKNEINLLLDYLARIKKNITLKYSNITNQKRSVDELLKLIDKKDDKIIELNKKIDELNWIEAKENSKDIMISELEEEFLKEIKNTNQEMTILKVHSIAIQRELDNLYNQVKQLNQDIMQLEAKNIQKEKIAMQLVKELKKELLASKYLLNK